jgi:hypothetical protein
MEQQTFALIYNNPEPNLAVLWPNYYEKDKDYLDTNYDVITEYDIKNLVWSAWLANTGQSFIVLQAKVTDEVPTDKPKKKK